MADYGECKIYSFFKQDLLIKKNGRKGKEEREKKSDRVKYQYL